MVGKRLLLAAFLFLVPALVHADVFKKGGTGGGGGSGTPGGSDTQVQVNVGGSFGGDAGLTFNESTDVLTVGGAVVVSPQTNTGGGFELPECEGGASCDTAGNGEVWGAKLPDNANPMGSDQKPDLDCGTHTSGECIFPGELTVKGTNKARYFPAWSLNADATQCADPVATTLNSGPVEGAIVCTDNDAGTIYLSLGMPDNWDAGTLTLKIHAHNDNASPSGDLDADVSAQCRGDSETVSNTWGTEIALDIAFTTQNDLEQAESAAVTATGTCAAGDQLFVRYQVDATGTTTQVADTNILGLTLGYAVADHDEVD